jgi:regulatory protein
MKITALKQQLKNPQRISVFVDGAYSFSLSLDELASQKIKNAQELSPAELKKLKKLSEDGKLRGRALEWLMSRPHSTRELRDYLRRKKAAQELAEKLVKEFTDKKYLDDAGYARWLTELRGRAGKSNRAIQAELYAKGIGGEQIEQVLGENRDEAERLRAVIAKKRRLSRYKNDEQKLKQYLLRQGFSYQAVDEELQNT